MPGRRIDENILALTELANFCDADESRGGIFVMLDNAKAYDRVQWPFLQKVLEAFQFPPFFCSLICRIRERYRALRYYLKLYTWG